MISLLDKKLSFTMFVKGLGDRLKTILGKAISNEEKLDLIIQEMEKDVQEKRTVARKIRSQMLALSDPDNTELEPLEKLKMRKEKLMKLGGQVLKEKESATNPEEVKRKQVQLSQVAQEVKTLTSSLSSIETTYQTLKESYEVALNSYKVGLGAYEHAKTNGKAMLFAIQAHEDALKVRDNAKSSSKEVDASFIDELAKELDKAQQELKSDKELDSELDSSNETSFLESQDLAEENTRIIEEFRKAQ